MLLKFGIKTCELSPQESENLYETCINSRNTTIEKYKNANISFIDEFFDIYTLFKSVYSVHNEEDAQVALTEFNNIWGKKYPNITASWTNHWDELSTFFLTKSASTRNI